MNKFWNYEINNYVDPKPGAIDNYKLKGKFYDDCTSLFDIIGTFPHPSLRLPVGKEHIEPTFLTFQHILIDINTVRILSQLLINSKIISLKFSSNSFELVVLESLITALLTKTNTIFTLVYEWNHTVKLENTKDVISWGKPEKPIEKQDIHYDLLSKVHLQLARIGTSTKIESLCLRGNYLGDDAIILLLENLKTNNSLKIINLFNNRITSKGFAVFCKFLETNKKLEEVHFGKNELVDEDLVLFRKSLGKYLMTLEEVDTQQKKIKERDIVLEKNKKLKAQKKPEEPIPIVEEFVQVGDNFYIYKNTKLRSINLMQNNFKNFYDLVISVLRQTEALFITIDSMLFDKDQKHSLTYPSSNMNFSTRIYLSK